MKEDVVFCPQQFSNGKTYKFIVVKQINDLLIESQNLRILELERTHTVHQVQLLASQRTNQNSNLYV